ncbi:MAG: shikimate kinase [Salinivirgaceae bacterium]|nr:shikimate kinase [Salinivirgaceae bacterium]
MKTQLPERIFLIGFMGCGKTTAGKRLAQLINYQFVDLDELIVQKKGMSVAALFENEGEENFRLLEKQVLAEVFEMRQVVVATGGGAPCFFDNMEQMNKHGISVYIKLTPKALLSRLRNAKEQRPLLKYKNEEELLEFITQMLQKRESFYLKAMLNIEGIGLTASDILRVIENGSGLA